MSIVQVTSREFRSKQASLFSLADNGEKIIIRRGKKRSYTLVPINDDELTITPELQAKIFKAEKECKEGKCTRLSTHEDIDKYFENL